MHRQLLTTLLMAMVFVSTSAAAPVHAAPTPGLTLGLSTNQESAGGEQIVSTDSDNNHATLLIKSTSETIDLNPFGFAASAALGTDGVKQVGYGIAADGDPEHAIVWYGSAASAVDLNRKGATASVAVAVEQTQELGATITARNPEHATLWRGSARSAIDLNPAGFTTSVANGSDGTHEIGQGSGAKTKNLNNALLWNGTSKKAIDLNPTKLKNVRSSFGLSLQNGEEVGYAVEANKSHHALLWHGTAASAVDLNPSGFTFSVANGTNGANQVGEGYGPETGGQIHALIWSNSSKSYVDLGASLPSKFTQSFAMSIDAAGQIDGYAETASGEVQAMQWDAPASINSAPEPRYACSIVLAMFTLLSRKPKRE